MDPEDIVRSQAEGRSLLWEVTRMFAEGLTLDERYGLGLRIVQYLNRTEPAPPFSPQYDLIGDAEQAQGPES